MGDASSSPLIVYVTLALGVLGLIAGAVPRILGPLGVAMSDWTQRRRRIASEAEDARFTDLKQDIIYFKAELAANKADLIAFRAEMRARNELVLAHEQWDRDLIREHLIAVPNAVIPTPPKLDYP